MKKKTKFPPSGKILNFYQVELNRAPRAFLLQVIECLMIEKLQPIYKNPNDLIDLQVALYEHARQLMESDREADKAPKAQEARHGR